MNTVKRWLAGFLSFAMIFTSAAFGNVGSVFAAEVQADSASARFKVTIGTTTTYWETAREAFQEVNAETDMSKPATIELINANSRFNRSITVNHPVDVIYNGYTLTGTINLGSGICRGDLYNGDVLNGTSYKIHNAEKQYGWTFNDNNGANKGDNPLSPIWTVTSCNEVCENCGSTAGQLARYHSNIYNETLKQFEYREYDENYEVGSDEWLSDKYLVSTMSAEGYSIIDGPKFEMDGTKIRHDENGKPIVSVTILKNQDGSLVKEPDVSMTDPVAAEIANNKAYNPNGVTTITNYADWASTCTANGRKLYKVVVKDPEGKELITKYIADTQLPMISHEQGRIAQFQLLVRVGKDDQHGYNSTGFATEGAARQDAQTRNRKVEKITKRRVNDSVEYHYWYFRTMDSTNSDWSRTIYIDLLDGIDDDGSFTYRNIYTCIYGCGKEIEGTPAKVEPLADEQTAADHQANAASMASTTNPKPIMSTCTDWFYNPVPVPFTWIDRQGRKITTTYTYVHDNNFEDVYGRISKADFNALTHKAGTISEDVPPTCYSEGRGRGRCAICNEPRADWPIEKLTNHNPVGGGNFTGNIDEWTASGVDEDLLESHKLVINKAGAQWNTLLTVEPTCTERGGEYLWCTNAPGGHWYLTKELPALGHDLSTVVTVGDGTSLLDSYWCDWVGANPSPRVDYVFTAYQKCKREDDMYMTVRYHSIEGVDTETDKYKAVTYEVKAAGSDCVTPAKTIYTVSALTDSKTGKAVTLEINNGGGKGTNHDITVKKFTWSSNFEEATATGVCKVCKAEDVSAEATVTQTTEGNGITTFVASYNGATDTKKAFTLTNAVVSFDDSLITDGNRVKPEAGISQEVPNVTVTINGTVISPKLYDVVWTYSTQKKWAIATVDWTDAVKKSGDAVYVPGTKSNICQVDAKKRILPAWKYDLNGAERTFTGYVYDEYDPANTYKLIADIIPEDATVKYAVLDKAVEKGSSADFDETQKYQKKIEELTFDKDEVVIHDAGDYYVYAQITKDGYTTYTEYVGNFEIARPDVYIQIDDAVCTVGETPVLNKRVYDASTHKVVDVDWADFTITTVGGVALDQLNAGTYELNVQAPNYNIQTLADTYMGKVKVNPKDDATVAAEKVAEQLKNAKTDDELAAAYKAFIALTAEQQKIVKADNAAAALLDKAKAASDAADKKAAEKKALDDATAAANSAIASANAYASDATIKALIDALNAAIAKKDTAAIQKATADLNNAVASKKAAPAKKSTPSVKISTKSKTYKAKDLKKKAKSFKIKYSKTSGSGKATFKKSSGSKKLKVSKAGKITVKKGTKKGTYKIKVKLTVAANSKFNAKTVKKTIKVKVK